GKLSRHRHPGRPVQQVAAAVHTITAAESRDWHRESAQRCDKLAFSSVKDDPTADDDPAARNATVLTCHAACVGRASVILVTTSISVSIVNSSSGFRRDRTATHPPLIGRGYRKSCPLYPKSGTQGGFWRSWKSSNCQRERKLSWIFFLGWGFLGVCNIQRHTPFQLAANIGFLWSIPAVHLGQYFDGTDFIRRFDIPQILP